MMRVATLMRRWALMMGPVGFRLLGQDWVTHYAECADRLQEVIEEDCDLSPFYEVLQGRERGTE
jgi:hypothetical protein